MVLAFAKNPVRSLGRIVGRATTRADVSADHGLVELAVSAPIKRRLKPLHVVQHPPFVGRVVSSYADQRDAVVATGLKTHYRFLPDKLRFPDTRAYVIPGFLGFRPPRAYLDELGSAFEHGVAFVSVSDEDSLWRDGRHLILGGPRPAVQPDWHLEVATVISRILADQLLQEELAAREGRDPPTRIALIGHSKGGLIVHGISAAVRLAKTGQWETLFKVFPNLRDMDHRDLDDILNRLDKAYKLDSKKLKFSIATPFDGIGKTALQVARASGFSWLFAGAEDRFAPDYLERHYDTVDLDPTDPADGLDAVAFATLSENEAPNRAGFAHPFVAIADLAFHYGGATLVGGENDGLVGEQSRVFASRVSIPGQTHLTVFEDPTAARQAREGFAAAVNLQVP